MVADFLINHKIGPVLWVFDKPVSNSGRLASLVQKTGEESGIKWQTELTDQTDNKVARSNETVISSDSQILANCDKWFNLSSYMVSKKLKDTWLIDIW
jgi:hypothetical protein